MTQEKRPSIFHAPEVVAGNASTLSAAERSLGWKSCLYYFNKNLYDATKPEDIRIAQGLLKPLHILKLLFIDCTQSDTIHFNGGRSFFPSPKPITNRDKGLKRLIKILWNKMASPLEWADVRWLTFIGKKVLITFQGDDGRIHGYHRKHFPITHVHAFNTDIEISRDEIKQKSQSKLAKYHCRVFAVNPDLLNTLPHASFLPYSNIDIDEWNFIPETKNLRRKIIHAPSHMGIKGTEFILAAVERLKQEGFNFDFQLITGIPREKVKDLYSTADLLIDQLLVGWYGGVAVECMALGLPVMCYIREEDLQFVPPKLVHELPILKAQPDNIYAMIKNYLERNDLNELRRQSRAYVTRWHNPKLIAKYLRAERLTHFDPDNT